MFDSPEPLPASFTIPLTPPPLSALSAPAPAPPFAGDPKTPPLSWGDPDAGALIPPAPPAPLPPAPPFVFAFVLLFEGDGPVPVPSGPNAWRARVWGGDNQLIALPFLGVALLWGHWSHAVRCRRSVTPDGLEEATGCRGSGSA